MGVITFQAIVNHRDWTPTDDPDLAEFITIQNLTGHISHWTRSQAHAYARTCRVRFSDAHIRVEILRDQRVVEIIQG